MSDQAMHPAYPPRGVQVPRVALGPPPRALRAELVAVFLAGVAVGLSLGVLVVPEVATRLQLADQEALNAARETVLAEAAEKSGQVAAVALEALDMTPPEDGPPPHPAALGSLPENFQGPPLEAGPQPVRTAKGDLDRPPPRVLASYEVDAETFFTAALPVRAAKAPLPDEARGALVSTVAYAPGAPVPGLRGAYRGSVVDDGRTRRQPQAGISSRPRLAIVVEGIGDDLEPALRAAGLPAEVTLAFAPFGAADPRLVGLARLGGHEILAGLPAGAGADKGTWARLSGSSRPGFGALVEDALETFPEAVGVQLTKGAGSEGADTGAAIDAGVLGQVGGRVRTGGVLLLAAPGDAKAATGNGVPVLAPDLRLDPSIGADALRAKLTGLAARARVTGGVVVVVPADVTALAVLEEWLNSPDARGLALAPLTEMVGDG